VATKTNRVLIIGGVAVAALIALFVSRAAKPAGDQPATPVTVEDPAPPLPRAPAPPVPTPSPPAPRPSAAAPGSAPRLPQQNEQQIMDRLHDLGSSDPTQSLALAVEGNRRFRESADAPERASIIVKSLSSLGRHEESRDEARKMEQNYPGSDWTEDVHRHVFVNPPTHPAERGHGKKYELE